MILIVELTLLAVVAVPVRFPVWLPTKLEAVIIPLVLILIVELTLLAVVAVPVRFPTKPPVAVIIPLVLMLAVVENPRAVVAVVAVPVRLPVTVPVRFPTKLEAVTIPNTFVSPITSSFTVGCVEPIPIFVFVLEYTKSVAPAKSPLLAL